METWIELGGLTIRAPVTVFTNVLLGIQCALYGLRLWGEEGARSRYWALFFLAMAITTLAGAPKHGLRHVLPEGTFFVVLWIPSLGSALSVYYAQRATMASRAGVMPFWVVGLAFCQMLIFLGASIGLGPEMWLVVVNTAVGLIPVMMVEFVWFLRGEPRSGLVAGGLAGSMLTAIVYLTGASLGPWVTHIDIAHLMMAGAFWLMVRGGAAGPAQVDVSDFSLVGAVPVGGLPSGRREGE